MKTLWQQLKPDIKETLNDQEENYPSMVKAIKIALKDNYIWSHLSIGEVRDLVYFTDHTYASLSSYDWSYGEKFINADE